MIAIAEDAFYHNQIKSTLLRVPSMLYMGIGQVSGQVVSWCHLTNAMSMKSLVALLSRRAWTCCVCCMSMVIISISREREVADRVEAMVYCNAPS